MICVWLLVFFCVDVTYNFCLTETRCFCSTAPPTICHTQNCVQTNSAVICFAISAFPAIHNAPLTPPPSFWMRLRSTSSKFSHTKYTLLCCSGHRQWEERELGPSLCFGAKMVPRTIGRIWAMKYQKLLQRCLRSMEDSWRTIAALRLATVIRPYSTILNFWEISSTSLSAHGEWTRGWCSTGWPNLSPNSM